MNPLTGRFLSRDPEDGDPADPASLQKYAYSDSDPVDGIDPTGRGDQVDVAELQSGVRVAVGVAGRLTWTQAGAAGAAVGTGLGAFQFGVVCLVYADATGAGIAIGPDGATQFVSLVIQGCTALYHDIHHPQPGPGPGPQPGPKSPPPPPGPPPPAPPTPCNKGDHEHHMLPQQFRLRFAQCGIPDIDAPQFMRCVPQRCHTGKGGLHPGGWNPLWNAFLGPLGSRCQSESAIMNFMSQMEQQFATQFNCD